MNRQIAILWTRVEMRLVHYAGAISGFDLRDRASNTDATSRDGLLSTDIYATKAPVHEHEAHTRPARSFSVEATLFIYIRRSVSLCSGSSVELLKTHTELRGPQTEYPDHIRLSSIAG